MARSLYDLSDLCIGKPPLRPLSVRDTVADALAALKRIDDTYVSVWNCNHSSIRKQEPQLQVQDQCCCTCIGKICMVDIICFLSKPQNLSSPSAALHSPISALLHDKSAVLIRHLPPTAGLLEVIDVMHEGVQNLVIPVQYQFESSDSSNNVQHNNNTTYCWLTQENLFRYLLDSIAMFSPTPKNPINTLGVIETQNLFAVSDDAPASSILAFLALSLIYQSSIAIVDPNGKFCGEISPVMLNSCHEWIVPAIATLSAGDLSAYLDSGRRPEHLVQLMEGKGKTKVEKGKGKEKVEELSWSSFSSGCSSDQQFWSGKKWKDVVCYPWNSLIAVMTKALARGVSYVWVVEEDGTLRGIVTFQGMLKVFRDHLKSNQSV